MAMTGGTAKLVKSGTPPSWPDSVKLYVYYKEVSQSIANNTTTLSLGMYVTTPRNWDIGGWTDYNGSYIGTSTSGDNCKTFDGDIPNFSGTRWLVENQNITVKHNNDGSKAATIYWKWGVNSGWSGVMNNPSGSFSINLTKIPRAATITSAPNFNDEANPTITYENPAGSAVSKLEACISLTGAADDVAYRDISKTGSSYTFNLTDAERKVLRKAVESGNSQTVRFYVATTIGDTVYRESVSKTLTIVNGTPTLNPTIKDVGSVSAKLTGDANNIVIKGYNSMEVSTGAAARKEATIASQSVTCGSKSIKSASGSLGRVESGTFVFSVTDSRGNTTSRTINKTLIDYVKLTCNLAANKPTADGNMSFTISGNYFNGSFGATNNTLTVQYRYKQNDGSYSAWTTLTHTISSNKYTATGSLTGLDYQSYYTFQARALDKIYNADTEPAILSEEKRVKTTPVFDWGENDFAFHVPVVLDNSKQLYFKNTEGTDMMMVSLNNLNQSFFGYGGYNQSIGTTYFDGNSVNIRSRNNISNTAGGTIGGNKAWTNSSDSRLKEDIRDIPAVFCAIWAELQPKMFRWNELNNGDNTLHFGLIAQDVIEVFSKYGLDYRNYGFVATIPVEGVEYFAITYEYYNILTAKVLKNTLEEVNNLKNELAQIKAMIAS